MAKTHSSIGASGYYRWKECPGSVAFPPTSNVYAEEGTEAHELAEKLLRGETTYQQIELLGTHSAEMTDAVRVYVDYIKECQAKAGVVI